MILMSKPQSGRFSGFTPGGSLAKSDFNAGNTGAPTNRAIAASSSVGWYSGLPLADSERFFSYIRIFCRWQAGFSLPVIASGSVLPWINGT